MVLNNIIKNIGEKDEQISCVVVAWIDRYRWGAWWEGPGPACRSPLAPVNTAPACGSYVEGRASNYGPPKGYPAPANLVGGSSL